MRSDEVVTFQAGAGAAVRLHARASLAAASAELPEGAYTTFRTYERRRVVRLDRHLARLEQTAALQGRPARLDAAAARASVAAALDATAFAESRVRLTFAPPRLFVSVGPFQPPPADAYQRGVACVTLELERGEPHAKDTRFIAAAQGAYQRLPAGVEEGLLVAADGALLEGLSSNFFAVQEGALRTEAERVLLGITRSLVLEAAAPLLPLDPRPVHRDQLARVSEAFLTSVSRGVLPVARVDGRALGSGSVGPWTRAVMGAFGALVAREAERL